MLTYECDPIEQNSTDAYLIQHNFKDVYISLLFLKLRLFTIVFRRT
jgi:hypothetical protein